MMIISLWSRLLDIIAPRLCCACGCRLGTTEDAICSVCYMHLPRPVTEQSLTHNIMAQMFWGQVDIERACTLFYYTANSDTSRILYELKYHNRPDIGIAMGRLMAKELQQTSLFAGIDLLVPLPLAKSRERERGYNQSEMLVKGISEVTGIPYTTGAVERTVFRGSQTKLNKWERRENVEGIFHLKSPELLQDKHVLLVDDVITTGATMRECAKEMEQARGIRISCLTLAQTAP